MFIYYDYKNVCHKTIHLASQFCFNFTSCCYNFRSVQRNERPPLPPLPATHSPNKSTNGSVPDGAAIYRPNRHSLATHDRPRSVAAPRGTHPDTVPLSGASVKRASSVRGAAISSPRLESSTNQFALPSRTAPHRPYTADEIQLMPTRTAPTPPPSGVTDPHDHGLKPLNGESNQLRRAPSRPPLPAVSAPSRPPLPAVSAVKKELNHCGDDMPMRSPTGPPPAPPDSRHRFYSPPVALTRNASDSHANGRIDSRSNVLTRSPHHPGRSSSAVSAKKTVKPAGLHCSPVAPCAAGIHCSPVAPNASTANAEPRPLLPPKPPPVCVSSSPSRSRAYRPINESQC